MKNNPSTVFTSYRVAVWPDFAYLAPFAAGCMLPAIAFALFASPIFADEPASVTEAPAAEAPSAEAPSQEATTALEPPIEELRKQIGKPAEVTFTVMTVGGRTNLYLNSMKEWRSANCFTAMLGTEARNELKKLGTDEPFDDLIGRRVRCRGELELDRDRVRIVVSDLAKQFEFVDADAKAAESTAAPPAASATAEPAATPAPKGPTISPSIEELRASVGKEQVVTFRVLNAGGRSHLYINSQQNFRRADCFTAQVEPAAVKDLAALGLADTRTALIGKLLECRGIVKLTENRPSIVVTDVATQLKLVEEPPQPAAEAAKSADESKPAEVSKPEEPPAAL